MCRQRGSQGFSRSVRSTELGGTGGCDRIRAACIGQVTGSADADGRAECRGGARHRQSKPNREALENRYPSLGGSRVQIPPPPLFMPNPMRAIWFAASGRCRGVECKARRDLSGPPDAPPDRSATGARPAPSARPAHPRRGAVGAGLERRKRRRRQP